MCAEGEQRVKGLAGSGRRNWERAEGGYWGAWQHGELRPLGFWRRQHRGDGEIHGCRTWGAGHGAGDPSQHFGAAPARQGQTSAVPAEHGDKDTDTQSVALLRSFLITGGCQMDSAIEADVNCGFFPSKTDAWQLGD